MNKNLINDDKIDNSKIQSFEYEKTAISDGNIVGTCELGVATIQILDDSTDYEEIKGSWINTIHGSFYVTNVSPVQEKVNIKLECYDIKYKLDTPFDKESYNNMIPCTLMELRNAIFDKCEVLHDDTPFPNSELQLTKLPYFEEGISNRNVISIIAQAGGCWVDTDNQDKFYFNFFTDKVYEVNDYQELTTEKELTTPVNTVVLGRGDTEDNVYYPENIENRVPFRIDNNYILDPQDIDTTTDTRFNNIQALYEHLLGTQYLVFSMKTNTMLNKLDIKLGDKVKYKDIWGNIITAPVMRKKITFLGGDATKDNNYSLEISAEEIKETSTDFNYASSVENAILRVERKADKVNGVISDLVEKVKSVEKQVEVLKVEFDTSNIVVPTTGGNNPLQTYTYEIDYKVLYLNKEIKNDSTEEIDLGIESDTQTVSETNEDQTETPIEIKNLIKITTENNYEGITVSYNNEVIKFHVDSTKPITNIDNKYLFEFECKFDENTTYKVTKSIVLSITTNEECSTIYSEIEPEENTNFWYDTRNNQLKKYEVDKWVIIYDYSSDKTFIMKNMTELTKEQLNNLESAIIKEVQQTISTMMKQNETSFEFRFKDITKDLNTLLASEGDREKYIRFDNGTIILGDEEPKDSEGNPIVDDNGKEIIPFLLKINNFGIGIYKGNNASTSISSWEEDKFRTSIIRIGNFEFIPRTSNGSLSIRKADDSSDN